MKLFKVTYNGWDNCNFSIAFVFANDEFEAIRNVKDDDRTEHFNNVKCEELIKSGVIHNAYSESGV